MQIIGHPGAWESAQSLGDSETRSLRPHLEKHHLLVLQQGLIRKGLLQRAALLQNFSAVLFWEGRPWGRGKSWEFSPRIHHPSSASFALLKESAERVPAAAFMQLPGRPGCTSPRWWEECLPQSRPGNGRDEEAQRGLGGRGKRGSTAATERGLTRDATACSSFLLVASGAALSAQAGMCSLVLTKGHFLAE